jgi:uncharacterized membrane protein YidH (DUF202 family)
MSDAPPAVDATRRTRLANERTFLAWWRTALATLGLGVALGKVLPEVSDPPHWPYVAVGAVCSLLGAALAGLGWWRYASVDRALDGGEEARPPSWVATSLSAALLLMALVVAVLVLVA